MREPKKTRYRLYLEELTELAKQQVEDKLKTKMRARIYEKDGPSLLRDEYDETDVLFLVYAERRQAQDEKSLQHLRKTAVELFMGAMCETEPNLTVISYLGHLAALYEFRKDKPLSDHLSNELFGFLSGRLRHSLEHLANLDGIQLMLAIYALDMWITTHRFSLQLDLPGHTLKRIEEMFEYAVNTIGASRYPTEEQFRLLLTTFRAVILLQPRWTGQVGFLKMVDAVDRLNARSSTIRKQWGRLCREYGARFRQNPEWRTAFWGGVSELKQSPIKNIHNFSLVKESLGRMGFEEQIDTIWMPIQPIKHEAKTIQLDFTRKKAS
jgi:hypothetical protein